MQLLGLTASARLRAAFPLMSAVFESTTRRPGSASHMGGEVQARLSVPVRSIVHPSPLSLPPSMAFGSSTPRHKLVRRAPAGSPWLLHIASTQNLGPMAEWRSLLLELGFPESAARSVVARTADEAVDAALSWTASRMTLAAAEPDPELDGEALSQPPAVNMHINISVVTAGPTGAPGPSSAVATPALPAGPAGCSGDQSCVRGAVRLGKCCSTCPKHTMWCETRHWKQQTEYADEPSWTGYLVITAPTGKPQLRGFHPVGWRALCDRLGLPPSQVEGRLSACGLQLFTVRCERAARAIRAASGKSEPLPTH